MSKQRRTTTADIAHAAGVSRATVSYVLNKRPKSGISKETAEKIQQIAQELNYVPSAAARILRSGSSNLVLGILPSWDLGPTYPQIFSKIGEQLHTLGYGFVLQSFGTDNFNMEELLKFVAPCLVVTLVELPDSQKKTLKAAGIPHILIDLSAFVSVAGRTQIQFLHNKGRTRMLYVLPDHYLPDILVTPRIHSMEQTAQELGLPLPQVVRLPYTTEGIAELEETYLNMPPETYGICAHTDEVASFLYTMLGIQRFGPSRLGLIGVGNRPISNIGITTVSLDVAYWATIWIAPILKILTESYQPVPTIENQSMAVKERQSV